MNREGRSSKSLMMLRLRMSSYYQAFTVEASSAVARCAVVVPEMGSILLLSTVSCSSGPEGPVGSAGAWRIAIRTSFSNWGVYPS